MASSASIFSCENNTLTENDIQKILDSSKFYNEYTMKKDFKIETINNNVEISKPNFQGNKTYTLSEIKTIMNQKMKNLKSSETTTQEGNTTTKKKTIIIK